MAYYHRYNGRRSFQCFGGYSSATFSYSLETKIIFTLSSSPSAVFHPFQKTIVPYPYFNFNSLKHSSHLKMHNFLVFLPVYDFVMFKMYDGSEAFFKTLIYYASPIGYNSFFSVCTIGFQF